MFCAIRRTTGFALRGSTDLFRTNSVLPYLTLFVLLLGCRADLWHTVPYRSTTYSANPLLYSANPGNCIFIPESKERNDRNEALKVLKSCIEHDQANIA
jgi:hypothetical protein